MKGVTLRRIEKPQGDENTSRICVLDHVQQRATVLPHPHANHLLSDSPCNTACCTCWLHLGRATKTDSQTETERARDRQTDGERKKDTQTEIDADTGERLKKSVKLGGRELTS